MRKAFQIPSVGDFCGEFTGFNGMLPLYSFLPLWAQYLPLLCETSTTGLHPQETAVCFQRNTVFASTFIREFLCLLHVKKPETPPILADSIKYWDCYYSISVMWKGCRIRQAEPVWSGSGRSDRSLLCASGTALPRPGGPAGNLLLLKSSVAATPADWMSSPRQL